MAWSPNHYIILNYGSTGGFEGTLSETEDSFFGGKVYSLFFWQEQKNESRIAITPICEILNFFYHEWADI